MEEIFSSILSGVGTIVLAGGGGALIAWLIIKATSEKWLQAQFDKQLQSFKHEQQKELEHIRYRVNSYFDRAVRLHQMEFEILPELWERLQAARNAIIVLGSPLQQIEDLNQMSKPVLEEFLAQTTLLETQKEELRASANKTEYFRKARTWERLSECKSKYHNHRTYLARMSVFLDPQLEDRFAQVDGLIWDAIVEFELNLHPGVTPKKRADYDRLMKEGGDLINQIKAVVQAGLRDAKLAL